jgi:N-acetyl sugar amidotransferase
MDTSDQDIEFDHAGVCNHCKEYAERARRELHPGERGRDDLDKVVSAIKKAGKGKEYDCIIGLSGGVDSTLVAYQVKHLGLRPLAIHLDNGWDSEMSVANIEQIVKKLEIDLYTYVIDWEEFRDMQVAFFKSSISNIEIPTDHAIWALIVKAATERGIKYFISGHNLATEGVLPRSWGYDAFDLRFVLAIQRKFGTVKLRTFPRLGLMPRLYYIYLQNLRAVRLLDYVDYNRNEAKRLLEREIGWRDYGGKHYESVFTRFFQGYILPRKFGIDKRRAHLSALICSGQIQRSETLEIITHDPYPSVEMMREDREYVIKKLGLSEAEFEQIMAEPVKSYRDYPNDDELRQTLLAIYRLKVKISDMFSGK